MSFSARRQSLRGLGSAVAMAVALAGGSVIGAAATGSAAMAQEQPDLTPSREFNKVYQPVADIAYATAGDFAAAKAQLPALLAAAQTADDRYLTGSASYVLGLKLRDRALQLQGMELMLQSGKATRVAAAELSYHLGEAAYDAQQWAKARQLLQAARTGGYTAGNAEGLTAESYFKEGQFQPGIAYLEGLVQQRAAAGQEVPEVWLRRALQVALDQQMSEEANRLSALLVRHSPTERNWRDAITVIAQVNTLEPKAQLDLLRLMALTDALSDRRAYERYIEAADPRVNASEVSRVLAAGLSAGVFASGDEYYADVKRIVDERMAEERSDASAYAAEARGAANGRAARNAGEVYLALESFGEAEEMFKLALEKGGIDRDEVLTRLGIAQVRQNKLADARATFEQVSGARAAVARMWSAYVSSRA
ncbi:MAG TPA: hypothetical protein VEB68_05705 [Croceibacterium sp.]|nr:hypothetical protein [Croceibacterium sp.]